MLLALDIGNTNIEIGLLNTSLTKSPVIASIRLFTRLEITHDEIGLFLYHFLSLHRIQPETIRAMVYSSVVPPLNQRIEAAFNTYFKGTIIGVTGRTTTGIINCYKNPDEVGSDRLVNSAAVYQEYRRNAVIIDMGTATTLDLVTSDGRYLGGAIVPGIQISTQALTQRASRLPAISISARKKLLADDTAGAIEAGVYFSNYYAMKGMIRQIAEEAGFDDYLVIATGGYSSIFKDSDLFEMIDMDLAIKGLKVIYDLNTSAR